MGQSQSAAFFRRHMRTDRTANGLSIGERKTRMTEP